MAYVGSQLRPLFAWSRLDTPIARKKDILHFFQPHVFFDLSAVPGDLCDGSHCLQYHA
jgi:hypothetical protein